MRDSPADDHAREWSVRRGCARSDRLDRMADRTRRWPLCAAHRPSAPTMSAACSAQPRLLAARGEFAAGQHRRRRAAGGRGRGHPRGRPDAGRDRPAVGHRRRVPARLLAHGLHLPARRGQQGAGQPGRAVPATPPGAIEFTPAALRVDGKIRLDQTIFERRLQLPAVGGDHGHAQAHHPVAEHGALPRRPGGLDPAVYPDIEEFWSDLAAAYADEVAAPGRPGLHLPAARRHQPGLPQRPGAAGRDRRAGRGRRAPAPALHPAGQRRARAPARPAWR